MEEGTHEVPTLNGILLLFLYSFTDDDDDDDDGIAMLLFEITLFVLCLEATV